MEIKKIKMNQMHAQPLARTVEMPEGHHYPTGAVSVRFDNMSLPDGLSIKQRLAQAHDEGTRLTLDFLPARFTCDCIVEARPDPVIDIDTAGRLTTAPAREADPEKEQWLEQSRAERTKLAQTPNGQRLLIEYGKHNEVYDEIFHESIFLQIWKADGVMEEMSRDTYQAVKNNSTINDKSYNLANGHTVEYNYQAFYQQAALSLATLMQDPDYDPFSEDPPKPSKYTIASDAAADFGRAVTITGNQKNKTTPLRPDQVYREINMPHREAGALPDAVSGVYVPGGYDIARYYAARANDARMMRNGGEDDEYGLGGMFNELLARRAMRADVQGHVLYTATCSGVLDGETFSAEVLISRTGSAVTDVTVERFALPDFDLELDDSAWRGAAADIARERLGNMDFLHNYLHRAIAEALSSMVRGVVASDENFHIG